MFLFINEGEKLKIDTRSGEYVERAKISEIGFNYVANKLKK